MRISDHFLEIEKGRYKRMKRENRICQYCHTNDIEDEFHFFFKCPKYKSIRDEFEHKNIKTFKLENDIIQINNLVKILSSSNHLQHVAPFIKKSLVLRKVEPVIA